jgi:hypothetical protein
MANSRCGLIVSWVFLVIALAALAACTPRGNHWADGDGDADVDSDADQDTPPSPDDADGDGISDINENREEGRDTDGDGIPDYLDDDSDGDSIPDAIESGTGGDPSRPPRDSDADGTPDFRDVDSDANGIFDVAEGGGDADSDGIPDHADRDNDGDNIPDTEEIGDPSSPRDSDGDGIPDYYDLDSDADMIADMHEGSIDTDRDGIPDYLDEDTDSDGIPDHAEAGDEDLNTPPVNSDDDDDPDFRDVDSDNDGLSDADEAGAGTNPRERDSDSDGVSDLIEVTAGTNPNDASENPRTLGDFVFLVPYMEPPDPARDTLSFSTDIQFADVYFLVDCTGSMGGELGNLRSGLTSTIIPGIDAAIPDAWFGVGRFEDYPTSPYGGGSDRAYENYLNSTPDAAAAQEAVNRLNLRSGNDGPESHVPALHAVATGCGDGGGIGVADDAACADPGLNGYPHFRAGAVPVILLMTDAPFHNGPGGANPYGGIPGVTPPTYDQIVAELNAIHARVIGVNSGADYGQPHLAQLARDTGTMDAAGTPLVYDVGGDGSRLGVEIIDAVGDVANAIPMDISARAVDDPSDDVDATLFIDRIVPAPDAGDPCTPGLTVEGDIFRAVLPGSTVCFDIIPRQNDSVEHTPEPQLFMATVQVWGDDVTNLDERDIYFLVPPHIEGPGGPD